MAENSGCDLIVLGTRGYGQIHVATPDGECKFWLDPVRLAGNKNVALHVVR